MNNHFYLRYSTWLAILFLAFGLVARGHAQSNGNVTTLDDAYATLAHADHDYKGHRARAMKQIEQAVKELGGAISGHGHVREPQAASDAQLREALAMLSQAAGGLTGKALKHVNNAIEQINTALSVR